MGAQSPLTRNTAGPLQARAGRSVVLTTLPPSAKTCLLERYTNKKRSLAFTAAEAKGSRGCDYQMVALLPYHTGSDDMFPYGQQGGSVQFQELTSDGGLMRTVYGSMNRAWEHRAP